MAKSASKPKEQQFNVNNLNDLTTVTNGWSLTLAGGTTAVATNVTVNTLPAALYGDFSFARDGFTIASGNNTFTAVAHNIYGRWATNTVAVTVNASNNAYAYDLNGNLLTDGTRQFVWDDENQLISVYVTNVWREDFVYDGKLRRRITRQYTWNGGWQLTKEAHDVYAGNVVVQERDQNNLPQVSYTRGNDLSGTLEGAGGIGGLLARTDNSKLSLSDPFATTVYHADGNGNVTALIYTNATIAAKYLYDPYGNTLAESGPLAEANVYRFSSKEWDANAGLYYYLYRFYEPALQRWPNRDPLGEMGGINLYGFLGNRPINTLDLYGAKPLTADDCNRFLTDSLNNLSSEVGSDILAGVLVEIATGAAAIVVAPVTGGVGSIIVVGGGLIYGVYDAGGIIGEYLEQAQRIHDMYQKCMDSVCKSSK